MTLSIVAHHKYYLLHGKQGLLDTYTVMAEYNGFIHEVATYTMELEATLVLNALQVADQYRVAI